jgi:hypothetical protein
MVSAAKPTEEISIKQNATVTIAIEIFFIAQLL